MQGCQYIFRKTSACQCFRQIPQGGQRNLSGKNSSIGSATVIVPFSTFDGATSSIHTEARDRERERGGEMSGHDSKYFSTTKKGEIPELKEELNSQYKVPLFLSQSLLFVCIYAYSVLSVYANGCGSNTAAVPRRIFIT